MNATVTFAPGTAGRTDVLVNGEKVGEVFRADFTTSVVVTSRGDSHGHGVGRSVTRSNRWTWVMEDGLSGDDFASRKAAVDDLLCFI